MKMKERRGSRSYTDNILRSMRFRIIDNAPSSSTYPPMTPTNPIDLSTSSDGEERGPASGASTFEESTFDMDMNDTHHSGRNENSSRIKQIKYPYTPPQQFRVAPRGRPSTLNRVPARIPFNIPPVATPFTPPISPNTICVRQGGIQMSNVEYDFYRSIDPNAPMLASLNTSLAGNVADIGKMGLVLLRYLISSRMDNEVYEECVSLYAQNQITLLPEVSELGEIAPRVFQLGQTFYLNIESKKQEKAPNKNSAVHKFSFPPSLRLCSKEFRGSPPFKDNAVVSVQHVSNIPSDVQRALSALIRHILPQLFLRENDHQRFAVRLDSKNAKSEHQTLPKNVVHFVQDFCMASFGYPSGISFAGYTYNELCTDSLSLTSRLGNTEGERLESFSLLLNDVRLFRNIVLDKLQRTLNDKRKSNILFVEHEIDGRTYRVAEFAATKKNQINQPDAEYQEDHDNADQM